MSPPKLPDPPDARDRALAIRERKQNVLIDAGAGTGKTTTLVRRMVEMLAPENGEPVPISRIAAVTFTRRAAGELRLRIREEILRALADAEIDDRRRELLREALAGLDTAHVGTIHGFADRLLRLRPKEARLSPAYEIAEDPSLLVYETYSLLLDTAQRGTLAAELEGTPVASMAAEAEQTVRDAIAAGLRVESKEVDWGRLGGLDALVENFILKRDLPPPVPEVEEFDADECRAAAGKFAAAVHGLPGSSRGTTWMKRAASLLRSLARQGDPASLHRELANGRLKLPKLLKGRDFPYDKEGWAAWNALTQVDGCLWKAIQKPAVRWLAKRLVRLFPVIVALYEKVKMRHGALDQVDLLLQLRDLLRRDLEVRGWYQQLFDHLFVDEFQDTDPLQAEIVVYLCEKEPRAASWEDVVVESGKLTLVGDPKQSIYRFRRADIAMYDRVRRLVASRPHRAVTLSANFRSRPSLIEWFNERFDRMLGKVEAGKPEFDAETGAVVNQPLAAGLTATGVPAAAEPTVHVLAYDLLPREKKPKVDECRKVEGEALARYLRWLVEKSGVQVRDPFGGELRPVRYGDVAVLALVTTKLRFLFGELSRYGVPHTARGGTLFLQDAVHRQFLLGLRAVADRDDGIAAAALLRPPFFSVDLLDLVHARVEGKGGKGTDGARVERAKAALDWIADLRRRRFERPPGETARDLLEKSAIARSVALGPNGTQRLRDLREICLALEEIAVREHLDYDGATARLRDWVEHPIQLDPPFPAGGNAMQILTVHQAKGLEFPVVVAWDGKADANVRADQSEWRVDREGKGWALVLHRLSWEEPAGANLKAIEQKYRLAERKRLVYVEATRARDLLVLPQACAVDPKTIAGRLIQGADLGNVRVLETYLEGSGAQWSKRIAPAVEADPAIVTTEDEEIRARWLEAAAESTKPRFMPVAVSGVALAVEEEEAVVVPRRREGRYGPTFGETVHRAIGHALREPGASSQECVTLAARSTGLVDHLPEAAADVVSALAALEADGLRRVPDPTLRLEYPLVGLRDGTMLIGYADLVAVSDEFLDVIDFKTGRPPEAPVEQAYPKYVQQVRVYGQLLQAAGLVGTRKLRHGLLFTAEPRVRWIVSPPAA